MLSAIQETVGNRGFLGAEAVLLPDDVGPVRIRRHMDELLKAEREAAMRS